MHGHAYVHADAYISTGTCGANVRVCLECEMIGVSALLGCMARKVTM